MLFFFCDLHVLTRKLAHPSSVWPPNARLYASSACSYLRLLASQFGQGYNTPDACHTDQGYKFALFSLLLFISERAFEQATGKDTKRRSG